MIAELIIQNLGLINKSHINFKEKLNVITGESGSGKSLILKAIYLLFNDRVSKEFIGEFSDELYIKLVCEPNKVMLDFLKDNNLQLSDDDYLIIEKTVSKTKKTVSRLNHQMVSQDFFKKLSPYIVSFSLQNETSLFQDPNYILNILDSEHIDILLKFQEYYEKYQLLQKEINELIKNKKNNEEKVAFYEFQLNELNEFQLQESDFDIDNIIKRAKNQEKILGLANDIMSKLDNSYEMLESVNYNIDNLKKYDETFDQLNDFMDFFYQIEGFQDNIRKYISLIDNDEEIDITSLQSRSFKLKDLQKKFGQTYEEIKKEEEQLFYKIENVKNFDDILESKQKELKSMYEKYIVPYAGELHNKRKAYANTLSKIVSKHLAEMGMENTKILFSIEMTDNVNKYGFDNIDILIQHLQQEAKPIAKIASGGELSRIILALKIVTAQKDNSSVMIFDEIDSGTGGKTANYIGKKLKLLSTQKQIICITHTPQVACFSDHHIFVNKKVENNQYISTSIELNNDEVIMEIARMISGNEINDITIENAKQLRNGINV